jgi:hypothetical protein
MFVVPPKSASDGDSALDGLYSAPPERFVDERTNAVRRLRMQGQDDLARQISKLRRPTRAASAINRAVLRYPGKASGLVAASRELRRAHESAVQRQGDPALLKDAARQERQAIEELEQSALGIMRAEGKKPSPEVQRRMRETLEAVSHDEELLAQFADGRLQHEHRASTLSLPDSTDGAAPRRNFADRRRAQLVRDAEREWRRTERLVSGREAKLERAQMAQERANENYVSARKQLIEAQAALKAAKQQLEHLRRPR